MIPSISSARLTLRPFRKTDALALHAILSAPDVLMYDADPTPPPLERIPAMIDGMLSQWETRGYGLWAMTRRETGDFMGRCGLLYLPETNEIAVDVLIGPDYWGLGYASEAIGMALAFGFARPEVDRIVCLVHPDNVASARVLEKNGMVRHGRARYFGGERDRYEITRAER